MIEPDISISFGELEQQGILDKQELLTREVFEFYRQKAVALGARLQGFQFYRGQKLKKFNQADVTRNYGSLTAHAMNMKARTNERSGS
jgi:hypothetical protein